MALVVALPTFILDPTAHALLLSPTNKLTSIQLHTDTTYIMPLVTLDDLKKTKATIQARPQNSATTSKVRESPRFDQVEFANILEATCHV